MDYVYATNYVYIAASWHYAYTHDADVAIIPRNNEKTLMLFEKLNFSLLFFLLCALLNNVVAKGYNNELVQVWLISPVQLCRVDLE